ncbi:MAG: YebC/PmpR family DNA-binding transcriptional regulator [Gemmatimonadota bacterium]|jgi:YebC/PmpR family DNA-binding regulatory protein|nr:MAG: YebC/PmpR family DNA-binding transcriptional regulator [Gemmatimonadota bacterium]
MAGHSKWAQIKRQKARNDQARGKMFSKLAREITVAARQAGGDPGFNPRLRTAIDNAKAENMPNENIDRAIKRGTGALPGTSFEECTYEGYGPGGAALFLECLTDNQNRTVAEIRHIFDKRGGNLGQSGSVAWMFDRLGQIHVDAARYDEEALLEAAMLAGAADMRREEDVFVITCQPADFHAVQEGLREAGIEIREAELGMVAKSDVRVEGRDAERLIGLLGALEEHDDVQRVYSNMDVDEEALAAVAS